MQPIYSQQDRSERLIAGSRIVLALLSVAIIAGDRSVAAGRTPQALAVTGFLLLWSLAVAAVVWMKGLRSMRTCLAVHVVDIVLFSAAIYLTQTPISPLFSLFLFALFEATLRFSVRGTLLTGVAVTAVYALLGMTHGLAQAEPAFFVSRLAYIAVSTLLLVSLRSYQQRMHDDLTRLASWPLSAPRERDPLIRETLTMAAELLRVHRVVATWEEGEEPWLWVATLDSGDFALRREAPVEDDELQQRFAPDATASPLLEAENIRGRLFFCGRRTSNDDLVLSDIVARLTAARLDEFLLIDRMRSAAVGEERIRVARDLHDGLLQSLTGAALQLELAHHLIDGDPAAARERIRQVQEVIKTDQVDLRTLITKLRPRHITGGTTPLAARLASLKHRLRQQWDIEASITIEPYAAEMKESLAGEIFSIVSEALANAAKHAAATEASAKVIVEDDAIDITVEDNGHGFPFEGTFDLETLDKLRRGPVTLRERIASLGGSLTLRSSPSGVRLDITIPI